MPFRQTPQAETFVLKNPIETGDPDGLLLDLISSCFEPVTRFRNPMIMDLRPKRWIDPSSYAGFGARVPMHTDGAREQGNPRYIVMMCIVPDDGGDPEVADGGEALAMLDADAQREVCERQFDFRQAADSSCVGYTGPILTPTSIRFPPRSSSLACRKRGGAVRQGAAPLHQATGGAAGLDLDRRQLSRAARPHVRCASANASKRHFKRMYAEDR